MIRFHNRVVDTLPASVPPAQRFDEGAQAGHAALPVDAPHRLPAADLRPASSTTCSRTAASCSSRGRPRRRADDADRVLGRRVPARALHDPRGYNWNRLRRRRGTLDLLFDFSGAQRRPGRRHALPSNWIADFRRLYDFGEAGQADLAVPAGKFNRAMRIDTRLGEPAQEPAGLRRRRRRRPTSRSATSPARRWSGSPPGSRWPRSCTSKGVAADRSRTRQIRDGNGGATSTASRSRSGRARHEHAALVLHPPRGRAERRQAEGRRGAHRRRDVPPRDGGQPASIVRDPAWRPTLGPDATRSGWSTCCSSPSGEEGAAEPAREAERPRHGADELSVGQVLRPRSGLVSCPAEDRQHGLTDVFRARSGCCRAWSAVRNRRRASWISASWLILKTCSCKSMLPLHICWMELEEMRHGTAARLVYPRLSASRHLLVGGDLRSRRGRPKTASHARSHGPR